MRNRALFCAPIAVALVLLFLVAQNQAVLAAAWRSPLSVMSDRSPGKRAPGALYNTKPEREETAELVEPKAGGFPRERVLSASRVRDPIAELLPNEEPPLGFMPDGDPFAAGPSPILLDLPSLASAPLARSQSSRNLIPAGPAGRATGGLPGGTPEETPGLDEDPTETTPALEEPTGEIPDLDEGPTPTTPASPVPEPETWLMNIVGLFLVAGAMRARNRKGRAAASGSAPVLAR